MASRIQVRRDTAANWTANNPTLSSGEIGFVTDENRIKIGDAETAWNSLPYLEADAYLDSVVMGDDTTGNYVETLIASDGISISGEGAESASVTITNTGVLSLAGTTGEIDVSASSGNITLSLPTSITVDLVGSVTGNADTASTLQTSRSISLGGDISGSASFNGGADVTITATVADDSHNHIISNIDGLQTALDDKAPLASPSLSGTPTAPTASASANSTQIATTAFVQTAVSNLINGAPGALDTLDELAAALGDDANFASTVTNSLSLKAPTDSPTFTGTTTIPTLSLTTSDTSTTSTHYMVEVGSDGIIRPKTLDNVRTEIVTNAAVNSASATTVGTITSGTWSATDVALEHGGTNASLSAVNGGVVYSTASEFAITSAGAAGQVLISNGESAPTWGSVESGFNPFLLIGV